LPLSLIQSFKVKFHGGKVAVVSNTKKLVVAKAFSKTQNAT